VDEAVARVIAVGALVLSTCAVARLAWLARVPRVVRHGRCGRVSQRPAPAWLVDGLACADVGVEPSLVLRSWVGGATALVALAFVVGGVPFALLAVVVGSGGVPVALRLARHRADWGVESALPDALDGLARSLRGGASLRQAIVEVAPSTGGRLGADLQRVAADVVDGASLAEALDGWVARRPLPGVRLTTAALSLGAHTGGASARAIDGLAQTLRSNVAIAAEVRALSSQARLSALVIAVAPVGFTVLAASADPRTAQFLLRTPIGLGCLAAGLILDAVGGLWMRRSSAVRA